MSRKLLLFGGLSVASIATITPTGIYFQKEAQKRKERQDFINSSDGAVNLLNAKDNTKNNGMLFIKNNDYDDKWKLMWIMDIWLYYKKEKYKEIKNPMNYTREEMNHFEKTYWDNQVLKQQGKWGKQMSNQLLNQANSKPQYWEKFKEICLILMVNKKIEEKNVNSSHVELSLCSWIESLHDSSLKKYEEYKNKPESRLGIMEHFWAELKNRSN